MTKSLGAMVIAIFLACTVGAVPPSWGDDSGVAGFSFTVPTRSVLSNPLLPPAWVNNSSAAGVSFKATDTNFSSNLSLSSTGTPSLGYSAGAGGVGSISSGMAFQGFNGAERVSYEQSSSASGRFTFSASYGYKSQFPSSGITDLFSGFLFLP